MNRFVLTVLLVTFFFFDITNWNNCYQMEIAPVLKSVF